MCREFPRSSSRAGRFIASADQPVERAPDNAGISRFGVADLAGIVNVFMRQADLGNAYCFRIGSSAFPWAANLAPVLRRVVFVGKAALSLWPHPKGMDDVALARP